MATTPKGSHNKNNGAIVRHLRSRPLHSYTHRRSRPAVTIVRPLWGLTAGRLCAICYIIPTTRRHLGFATKMPDEHFYKSIMNKCVFAWLSSRQARLFLYSCAKLLIIIRFAKFPCIFFPPISLRFSPFSPFFRHYLPRLHFLTIGMGGRCFARARCCAR